MVNVMTEEQHTLQLIRAVVDALPENEKRAVYTARAEIKAALESPQPSIGLLALGLVGAELAAEE